MVKQFDKSPNADTLLAFAKQQTTIAISPLSQMASNEDGEEDKSTLKGLLRSFTRRNPLLVAGICFIGGLIIGMLVGATVALREKENQATPVLRGVPGPGAPGAAPAARPHLA